MASHTVKTKFTALFFNSLPLKTRLRFLVFLFTLSFAGVAASAQVAPAHTANTSAGSAKTFSKPNHSRDDAIIESPNTLNGMHLQLLSGEFGNAECGIYFSSIWSDAYDNSDAFYLSGPQSEVLYSLTSDGYPVGINSMGSYTKGKRVKLFVSATADGAYSLGLDGIQNIDTSVFHIYLVDNRQKDSVDVASGNPYPFTITNADTTTFGANRFVLAIERKVLPAYQLISFTGQKVDGGVLLTWTTSHEGSYTGFTIDKQNGNSAQYTTLYGVQSNGSGSYSYTDTHPVTGNNTYRLGQNNIDSLETYSNPLNVLYNSSSTAVLNVYPNPSAGQITINFNPPAGTGTGASYKTSIFSAAGLLMLQASETSNSWSQDISSLRAGAYILEVRADNGTLIGNTKFIKSR